MKTKLHGLLVLCLFTFVSCQKTEDDSFTTDNLSAVTAMPVSPGSWYVTLFSEDGDNETSKFYNYQFVFKADGTLVATKGTNEILGSWKKISDSGKTKLIITFTATYPFSEINEDWVIAFQNQESIRLTHVSGGNGGTDLLHFGRLPIATPGNDVSISEPSGSWKVSGYVDKGRDRTTYYAGFGFLFNANKTITVTTTSGNVSGTWKLIQDSGKNKLIMQFPAIARLNELNDDWEIIAQSDSVMQLKNVSGGNGGITTLTFIKQ